MWDRQFVKGSLNVSESEAQYVVDELARQGYIGEVKEGDSRVRWQITPEGSRLALASAARPIKRSTAEKKVRAFMERVGQINEDDYYLYRVTKVVVFGSYLSDSERINDVDIAVELSPKEPDPDRHTSLTRKRTKEAARANQRFRNILESIFWAEVEILKFLKSRSRTIHLHRVDYSFLKEADHEVLFEAPETNQGRHPVHHGQ